MRWLLVCVCVGIEEAEVEERVHEVLKTCGLYSFRNWPISALSFGQKKRVTIASILVLKPESLSWMSQRLVKITRLTQIS